MVSFADGFQTSCGLAISGEEGLFGFAPACIARFEKGAIRTGMRHEHVSRSAKADLRRGHRYKEPGARAPGKIGFAGPSYNQQGNAEPFYAELILPLLCRRRRSPNARLDGEQPNRAPAGPGVWISADEDKRERPRLLFQVLNFVMLCWIHFSLSHHSSLSGGQPLDLQNSFWSDTHNPARRS